MNVIDFSDWERSTLAFTVKRIFLLQTPLSVVGCGREYMRNDGSGILPLHVFFG